MKYDVQYVCRMSPIYTHGASQGRSWVPKSEKVAGTLHSETPWALGGGEGTIREISMTGFEECKWLPKNVKPSPSVAARRLERAPIFC